MPGLVPRTPRMIRPTPIGRRSHAEEQPSCPPAMLVPIRRDVAPGGPLVAMIDRARRVRRRTPGSTGVGSAITATTSCARLREHATLTVLGAAARPRDRVPARAALGRPAPDARGRDRPHRRAVHDPVTRRVRAAAAVHRAVAHDGGHPARHVHAAHPDPEHLRRTRRRARRSAGRGDRHGLLAHAEVVPRRPARSRYRRSSPGYGSRW